MKKFLEWIGVKEKLDNNQYNPPLISEADLYWCSVGENVGVEVGGKSAGFTRPVVVLKKIWPSWIFRNTYNNKKTRRFLVRHFLPQRRYGNSNVKPGAIV